MGESPATEVTHLSSFFPTLRNMYDILHYMKIDIQLTSVGLAHACPNNVSHSEYA